MTIRYVGIGGNDSNSGLTWALRKLTLNGVEDTPVEAGDTVYVGAGTYREMLTVDVDGSSGLPITYIGDYDGSHTDGTGGVVRITGSDNDQISARNYCIYSGSSRPYRTFKGFKLDGAASFFVYIGYTTSNYCIFDNIYCENYSSINNYIHIAGSNITIKNSYFIGSQYHLSLTNTDAIVENCIFIGGTRAISISGGDQNATIRNNLFISADYAVWVNSAISDGYAINFNNNICIGVNLRAAATGDLVEDYNLFTAGVTRTNVDTGAHSISGVLALDPRWFFEMVNGGSMLTPFDLASYSQLINVAGTSPTTADMRGTTKIGAEREWGALEYDPDLDIAPGSGGGGGSVKIVPLSGGVRL